MKTEKIRQFLCHLSDLDYRYLRIQCSMANDARNLIKEYQLSKEQFCKMIKIELSEFDSYLNGGFNYDIEKMALIQAAFTNLNKIRYEAELEGKITDVITK